jgi:hypothetical protein
MHATKPAQPHSHTHTGGNIFLKFISCPASRLTPYAKQYENVWAWPDKWKHRGIVSSDRLNWMLLKAKVTITEFKRNHDLWRNESQPFFTVKTKPKHVERAILWQKIYQYSETNVMQFLFSLLRIKDLYMFRALLAHPYEVLHKQHLVYCMRVMSVGCTRAGVPLQSLSSTSWGWASNARNTPRPLILKKLNKKCITLVSLYWYTVMHGQQNIRQKIYFCNTILLYN